MNYGRDSTQVRILGNADCRGTSQKPATTPVITEQNESDGEKSQVHVEPQSSRRIIKGAW